MAEKRYSFKPDRCKWCGAILKRKALIAQSGVRGDLSEGKCPNCGELLPLVVEPEE